MNQEEMKAKVTELFSDEDFVRSILELDTPEEVKEALSAKGLDISIQEINTIKDMIVRQGDGELNDEELESVSGGGLVAAAIIGAIAFAATGALLTEVGMRNSRRRW